MKEMLAHNKCLNARLCADEFGQAQILVRELDKHREMAAELERDQKELERYIKKQKMLGRDGLVKYRVLDNGKIRLVAVRDIENTGTFIIPSFISEIAEFAFENTSYTKIILNNQPNRNISLYKAFSFMYQTSIEVVVKHPDKVTSMEQAFFMSYEPKRISLPNFDWQSVQKSFNGIAKLFLGCSNLEQIDLGKLETLKPTSTSEMFSDCSKLSDIEFIYDIDFQKVETISDMFEYCDSIKQIDLSRLNLQSLKRADGAFRGCRNLESIQSKEIHIGNQCDTTDMFAWCIKLKDGELEKIT